METKHLTKGQMLYILYVLRRSEKQASMKSATFELHSHNIYVKVTDFTA